jgi:hypothetical protein
MPVPTGSYPASMYVAREDEGRRTMIWDYTIKWTDVAIIVATVIGPILAVQA